MFPQVVGQTFQNLENVSPRTYIGSGKTFEVEGAVDELEADTVIFDDELTPGMQPTSVEPFYVQLVQFMYTTALSCLVFQGQPR